MLLFFSFFVFVFTGIAWAKSAVGDKVLIILEEASEKSLYSQFWSDLEGGNSDISPTSDH